ncbi:hypothetical protein QOT17_002521 [Balamuthia mandrillaris]
MAQGRTIGKHTHPRSSTHHRISDCYASTTQGGNQPKEAEVETEAVQPQAGALLRLKSITNLCAPLPQRYWKLA